jgi:carbon-monoxide dehydrogenase large subunit|tara:strand:- start:5237 stop:7582 length:2346 start_codon:yes stop_codon:yes gene_type:complete
MVSNQEKGIGASIKRLEDSRFLRGSGRYIDDIQIPNMLHAAVLRSPYAHARVLHIDARPAFALSGVVAAFTFDDLASVKPIPIRLNPYGSLEPFLQSPLASDRVRYVGDPVALIVAQSRYQAEDALERVTVDYEPLPVHVDAEADPIIALHDDATDNVASHFVMEKGDVTTAFAKAEHVTKLRFVSGRHSGVPLETRGLLAHYDLFQRRLRVWGPTKVTHFNRGVLAHMLDIPESQIQMIEPDVGGGFGVRGEFYPEDHLIPYAALHLNRPVKWVEDRLENMVACNHSRQQVYEIELAINRDGKFLGMQVQLINDQGGYIRTHGVIVPELSAAILPGPYHIPNYRCEVRSVLTNKTPAGTYRAPGRYECNSARERLLDLAAAELGLDPVKLRLKNFIQPEEMPYNVGTHSLGEEIVYDSGDYPSALKDVLRLCNYQKHRACSTKTGARRTGLGMACFVEKTGLGPFEGARVLVDPTGHITISTGAANLGQGLETALAQIAADILTVAPEELTILHGDTDLIPFGVGSFASRATVMAGSAVHYAAQQVREKIMALSSDMLKAPLDALIMNNGKIQVSGAPDRLLTLSQVAEQASPNNCPPDMEPGLDITHYFRCRHMTYAHGATVVEVEVDTDTGAVTPKHIWVVYDVGTAINPRMVAGQVEGGAVQGLGGALLEAFEYDDGGQLLSGSFIDYLLPTAAEVPPLHLKQLQRSLSSLNPLGAKGAGECGIAGMGGAIANAVADALGEAGHQVNTLPMTPERVWKWLQAETPFQGEKQWYSNKA